MFSSLFSERWNSVTLFLTLCQLLVKLIFAIYILELINIFFQKVLKRVRLRAQVVKTIKFDFRRVFRFIFTALSFSKNQIKKSRIQQLSYSNKIIFKNSYFWKSIAFRILDSNFISVHKPAIRAFPYSSNGLVWELASSLIFNNNYYHSNYRGNFNTNMLGLYNTDIWPL